MRLLLFLLLLSIPRLGLAASDISAEERFVVHYAVQYRVPPELIGALIDVESRWNPHALSNKGAMGLMQLMAATAKRFGAFQPYDADQNIAAGPPLLSGLILEVRRALP